MTCTRTTPKCEWNPWEDNTNMPNCCRDHLIQTIHYTADLLSKNQIIHWLDFGSLLGALRNGKIIPWDCDGDFGVLLRDRNKILNLKEQIEKDGYKLNIGSSFADPYELAKNNLLQIHFSPINQTYVDLWIYETVHVNKRWPPFVTGTLPLSWPSVNAKPIKDNIFICRIVEPNGDIDHTCEFPYWFIKEMDTVKLEGKPIVCPRSKFQFIRFRYGNDWQIPVKKMWAYTGGNAFPLQTLIKFVKAKKSSR